MVQFTSVYLIKNTLSIADSRRVSSSVYMADIVQLVGKPSQIDAALEPLCGPLQVILELPYNPLFLTTHSSYQPLITLSGMEYIL